MIFVRSKKKKNKDNKKKYKTKLIRKFRQAWLKEFDWVVYEDQTKCTAPLLASTQN